MTPFIAYSCITGGYDQLAPGGAAQSLRATPAASFLCFSEKAGAAAPPPWQVRAINSPAELVTGHEINRYHKFFPQRVLPACDFSVYHDGNICYDADYSLLVERLRETGAALGAFRHPAGRSLDEELTECVRQGKLNKSEATIATDQIARYAAEGFDCGQAISANYLLVRDHRHPALRAAMELWWAQITTFSHRDQLSLGYVLWKTGLPFVFLDDSSSSSRGEGCPLPVRRGHRGERLRKRLRRLRSLVTGQSAKIGGPEEGSNSRNERIPRTKQ